MNRFEAESILRAVTYKPGFAIRLTDGLDGATLRLITAAQPDACGSSTPMVLETREDIAGGDLAVWGRHDLLLAVERLCAQWERHEMNEWLRYEGKPITEPHPELLAGGFGRSPETR